MLARINLPSWVCAKKHGRHHRNRPGAAREESSSSSGGSTGKKRGGSGSRRREARVSRSSHLDANAQETRRQTASSSRPPNVANPRIVRNATLSVPSANVKESWGNDVRRATCRGRPLGEPPLRAASSQLTPRQHSRAWPRGTRAKSFISRRPGLDKGSADAP